MFDLENSVQSLYDDPDFVTCLGEAKEINAKDPHTHLKCSAFQELNVRIGGMLFAEDVLMVGLGVDFFQPTDRCP